MTFNKLTIRKEVKIGYYLERVEDYIPAHLSYFKCQRYGHHSESCRGRPTCRRFSQRKPNIMEEDCPTESKCSNCQENHSAFSRSCGICKREREIMEEECWRNATFLEARNMIESYLKENLYPTIAQTACPINKNKQSDKEKALNEELVQLSPHHWSVSGTVKKSKISPKIVK